MADQYRILAEFRLNNNLISKRELIQKLDFTTQTIENWVNQGHLVPDKLGSYSLTNKYLRKYQVFIPQGQFEVDTRKLKLHPGANVEAAKVSIENLVRSNAVRQHLLINSVSWDDLKLKIEFLPARFAREQNHVVFDSFALNADGQHVTDGQLLKRAKQVEGMGSFLSGQYFRQLAADRPKDYHNTVAQITNYLRQRFDNIGRILKLSQDHRINPPQPSLRTTPLPDHPGVLFDPKTKSYFLSEKINSVPESEYKSLFTDLAKKEGFHSKTFASMTFDLPKKILFRGLAGLGIAWSAYDIAHAKDMVKEVAQVGVSTGTGIGGALAGSVIGARAGLAGAVIGGVVGGMAGYELTGELYDAIFGTDPKETKSKNPYQPYDKLRTNSFDHYSEIMTQAYENIRLNDEQEMFLRNVNAKLESGTEYNDPKRLIEEIEGVINDPQSQDKTETIETLIDSSEIQFKDFPEESKQWLNDLAYESQEKFAKDLSKIIQNFIVYSNTVIDGKTLSQVSREADVNALSFLHTAHAIFKFIDPKRAQFVEASIIHSSAVLSGATKLMSGLASAGVSFIGSTGFALATGDVLSGLTGIIGLFGRKDNSNAILEELMHVYLALNNQFAQMHVDMLEGFRQVSISLGIVDAHVLSGFLKLETMLNEHHQDVLGQFNQIKKLLYIDKAYLDQIKRLLLQNEKYHIQQQIHDADWRSEIEEIQQDCLLNPSAMDINILKKGLTKVVNTLNKVQRNGLARADQVTQLDDHARVANLLTTGSTYVMEHRPKKLADNYRLMTEQNIHLLVKFIKAQNEQKDLSSKLPQLESLHNLAALADLAKVAQQLIETYRNTFAYLGLPQDPVLPSLNIIMNAINDAESLLALLSNPDSVNSLMTEYLTELKRFSHYFTEYQKLSITHYYGDNILSKLKQKLVQDEQMLTSLDTTKTSDFFTMQASTSTPTAWFSYLWSHWWADVNRFSSFNWNEYGAISDRPRWKPESEIDKAKNIYRGNHHALARNRHSQLVGSQRNATQEIHNMYVLHNMANFEDKLVKYYYFDKGFLEEWKKVPYYFTNNAIPLLASSWHMQQLPQEIFDSMLLQYGKVKFDWGYNEAVGKINLHVTWEIEERAYPTSINFFSQETSVVHGFQQKLGLMESVYYTWNGGHLPTGACSEYDPDLQRFSNAYDTLASVEYFNGKVSYDCPMPSCHYPGYRATICMPHTTEVSGLFSYEQSLKQLSQSQVDSVSKWPHQSMSQQGLDEFSILLKQQKQKIRKNLIQDLTNLLQAGDENAVGAFSYLPEGFSQKLLKCFHKLSVLAKVNKMVLSLVYNSVKLSIDSSWPNIFDGDDILRELHNYYGQRVYLNSLLDRNHDALSAVLPKILKSLSEHKVEHYPFIYFKAEFQKFILEIAQRESVPNIVAESKPSNLYQLKQFITEIFPMLDMPTQQKLLSMNDALNKAVKHQYAALLPARGDKENSDSEIINLDITQQDSRPESKPIPAENNLGWGAWLYKKITSPFNSLTGNIIPAVAASETLITAKYSRHGFFTEERFLNSGAQYNSEENSNQGFVNVSYAHDSTFLQPQSFNESLVVAQFFIGYFLRMCRQHKAREVTQTKGFMVSRPTDTCNLNTFGVFKLNSAINNRLDFSQTPSLGR